MSVLTYQPIPFCSCTKEYPKSPNIETIPEHQHLGRWRPRPHPVQDIKSSLSEENRRPTRKSDHTLATNLTSILSQVRNLHSFSVCLWNDIAPRDRDQHNRHFPDWRRYERRVIDYVRQWTMLCGALDQQRKDRKRLVESGRGRNVDMDMDMEEVRKEQLVEDEARDEGSVVGR